MSDTQQLRKELRESLAQHLFHYHEELLKTTNQETARKTVLNEIDALRASFSSGGGNVSLLLQLQDLEKKWLSINKDSLKEKDIDKQMYSEDMLRAIQFIETGVETNYYGDK